MPFSALYKFVCVFKNELIVLFVTISGTPAFPVAQSSSGGWHQWCRCCWHTYSSWVMNCCQSAFRPTSRTLPPTKFSTRTCSTVCSSSSVPCSFSSYSTPASFRYTRIIEARSRRKKLSNKVFRFRKTVAIKDHTYFSRFIHTITKCHIDWWVVDISAHVISY